MGGERFDEVIKEYGPKPESYEPTPLSVLLDKAKLGIATPQEIGELELRASLLGMKPTLLVVS